MLRLAEGLRLPLGPDDFADYARAMEAAGFLVAEERQSVRGGRRKWVRNRPADETRNEHATVRSLQRLDCWRKPFPVWHVGWDATFPRLNRYVATVRSDMGLPAAGQCGGPCFAAKGATWQPVNPGAVFESTPLRDHF